jgi:GAF domain-containing protein
MTAPSTPGADLPTQEEALHTLVATAAKNIPGADFVSITTGTHDGPLSTVAATDPRAEMADELQYQLHEGPCYAAVTSQRFVLVNNLAGSPDFPRYAPRAVELGIGAQAAIQLLDGHQRAGINLYALAAGAFDRSTIELAELFATQAAALLGYAVQVEQLSTALHTRTDIGMAMGILMERYQMDHSQSFAYLSRVSQARNIKVRLLAQSVIDGSFDPRPTRIAHAEPGP